MKAIELTQGKYAVIDDEDFERVSGHKWRFDGRYAVTHYQESTKSPRKNLRLHRFILMVKRGESIDHINNDPLDNRRENLRICSHAENNWNKGLTVLNTSGFKGVYFHKASKKYMARIKVYGKTHYLGIFEEVKDAAMAYNEAARKMHGVFAKLNIV